MILEETQTAVDIDQVVKAIEVHFRSRTLAKGVSEVINSIVSYKSITKVYICGPLDLVYQRALKKALLETNRDLEIIVLSKKYTTLVYDTIKNISLDPLVPRTVPRRFFQCRAFAY